MHYETSALAAAHFYATLVSMIALALALMVLQSPAPPAANGQAEEDAASSAAEASTGVLAYAAADLRDRARQRLGAAMAELLLPARMDQRTEACALAQLTRRLAAQVPADQQTEEVATLIVAVNLSEEGACTGTVLEGANR